MENSSVSTANAAPTNRQIGKVAAGSIVGSIIEQYDFLVSGIVAATVWPTIFFGSLGGVFAAISTYALGIFIRPIGALIFGHIGDRVGRRDAMVYAIMLMGVATLIIGLTPTYAAIGATAVVILIIMRLLQGISFGAEFGTASTWVVEYANRSKLRVFWGAWVGFAIPIGLVLGLSSNLAMSSALTHSAYFAYGWRILFYIGFVIAVVGLIIRLRLEDSRLFENFKKDKKVLKYPAFAVWKEMPKRVLGTSLINGAFGAGFFLAFVFGNSYLQGIGYSASQASFVLLVSAGVMFFFMLVGSYLGEKFGRKVPIIISLAAVSIMAVPFFSLLDSHVLALAILGFVVVWSLGFGLAYGALPAIYTEFFPTKYRASGASAAYQFSQVYGGGLAPIVATAIFVSVGKLNAWPYVAAITVFYATMALVAMSYLKDTKGIDLEKY